MININKKFYKLTTLLIMLCLCFVVTGCKKNVQSSQDGWTCTCGTVNTSNFCSNCGTAKPVWTCSCGTENTGNFCGNCGKQKGEQQEQNKKVEQNQESNMNQTEIEEKTSNTSNPFINAEVGDYVKFGNYPQTAEGKEQPIEWRVLAKENNKMLVISRYGLDAKRFDDDSNVWANSEIRQWLNGDFYNKVFTEKEKKLINHSNLSDVATTDNVFLEKANDIMSLLSDVGTTDNVFLLSEEEVENYFANDEERRCKATEYAVKNGAFVVDSSFGDNAGYSDWWLRSPNLNYSSRVYIVNIGGFVKYGDVYCDFKLVRPALWIKLNN